MTIGYVLDDTLNKPDGVQVAMIAIAEQMRSRGHDVHYIVTNTKRRDLKNVHSMTRSLSFKFNGNSTRTPLPASKRQIKKLLNKVQFDVLHVQMPYSPLLSARVMRLASSKTRIIGTFHILPYGISSKVGTKLLGLWLKNSKKRFDKVYAVSPPAQAFMRKSFGIDGGVLPNPVDYGFFHKHSVKKGLKGKKKILFVGRFDKRKGVRQLVKAYEQLGSSVKDKIVLIMAGRGPVRKELVQYAKKHDLNIEFPGFVSEVKKAKLMAEADIAVFPSTGGESFGIVLIEAMSANAGVTIGGDNPGYSSVLSPWPYTLFDPNDIQKFSGHLTELITNDKQRLEIGLSQHEAVKQYDIKLVVDKLLRDAYK